MELKRTHKEFWLAATVLIIPLLFFHQVTRFYFVSFDDGEHLYRNPLLNPPTWEHFRFFWAHLHNGLYVPMTYTVWSVAVKASLALGIPIAANPGLFHALNLSLHALNSVLVFFLLRQFSLQYAGCILGALLFGLHPLQVESFAWISSFDGLLSSMLGLGSIICWVSWLRRESGLKWLACAFLFTAAVLSKPGAVTLPLIYLGASVFLAPRANLRRVAFFVAPLFLISLAFAFLAKVAQPDEKIRFLTPLLSRPLIAIDSLCFYVSKLILPFSLSVNYGRRPDLVLGSLVLKVEIALFAVGLIWLWRRKERKLWCFSLYLTLSVLLPVLGFIPFYFQKYSTVADRYMYLALLGPSFLLAHKLSQPRRVLVWGLVGGWLLWCGLKSRQQMAYWETDTTNVYRTTQVHPIADHHFNLAEMLWAEMEGRNPVPSAPMRPLSIPTTPVEIKNRIGQIQFHYEEAVRLNPNFEVGRSRLAQFKMQYPLPSPVY